MAQADVDIYVQGMTDMLEGNIDFENDVIKCALLNTDHSTNVNTQQYLDDVNANEVSGTGYTAGGKALENVSVSTEAIQNQGEVWADDVIWDSLVVSDIKYVLVYKDTGTASSSPLICVFPLSETHDLVYQDFSIIWHLDIVLHLNEE